jgi:hypothetical protein
MSAPIVIDVDEAPVAPEGWCIRTEDDAAFAVDRIVSIEEQIERVQRQYERNMTRLERELARAREFFEPHLQLYFAQHPPKKGRTLHLATGDISWRRQPGGVFVDDEVACMAWAEETFPDAVAREVKRSLDKERIKRHAQWLMSAATMECGSQLPTNDDELSAQVDRMLAAGRAALPPGVTFKVDVDVFSVKSPKGGR